MYLSSNGLDSGNASHFVGSKTVMDPITTDCTLCVATGGYWLSATSSCSPTTADGAYSTLSDCVTNNLVPTSVSTPSLSATSSFNSGNLMVPSAGPMTLDATTQETLITLQNQLGTSVTYTVVCTGSVFAVNSLTTATLTNACGQTVQVPARQ